MQFRQKLAYMALGGVLVIAGHVLPGLVVGSATAQNGPQDAEFNEVTVRKLTVVDVLGTPIVRLQQGKRGGVVSVNGDGGKTAVGLAVDDDSRSGLIELYPPPGSALGRGAALSLRVNRYGGRVNLYGKRDSALVAIGVNRGGNGVVSTRDKNSNLQ